MTTVSLVVLGVVYKPCVGDLRSLRIKTVCLSIVYTFVKPVTSLLTKMTLVELKTYETKETFSVDKKKGRILKKN